MIFSVTELRNDSKMCLLPLTIVDYALKIFWYSQICSIVFRFQSAWFNQITDFFFLKKNRNKIKIQVPTPKSSETKRASNGP